MSFHAVHDTQQTFRHLIDCSAFPGKCVSLGREAKKIDLELPFSRSTALLVLTLLDGEVSFYAEKVETVRHISQLTYSRPAPLDRADFLFMEEGDCPDLIEKAGRGTLIDPHLGATVIFPVESLGNGGAGDTYELSGPGIETVKIVKIGAPDGWLSSREMANGEFPLGVDIYFIDREDKLMVIPRTTKIRRIN